MIQFLIRAIIPCSTNISNCTNQFSVLFLQNKIGKIYSWFVPLTLVGYEMIIINLALYAPRWLLPSFIKFSTCDNAFLVLWLVHSISVISSYTLVWPYMVKCKCEISLWIQHTQKKTFGSFPTFTSTRKGKKCCCDEPASVWSYTTDRISSQSHQVFSMLLGFARFFARISYFLNFWSLRNLIKQLFHSRLLDMRLVIVNWALRASLAIYLLISNARSWNNCSL